MSDATDFVSIDGPLELNGNSVRWLMPVRAGAGNPKPLISLDDFIVALGHTLAADAGLTIVAIMGVRFFRPHEVIQHCRDNSLPVYPALLTLTEIIDQRIACQRLAGDIPAG